MKREKTVAINVRGGKEICKVKVWNMALTLRRITSHAFYLERYLIFGSEASYPDQHFFFLLLSAQVILESCFPVYHLVCLAVFCGQALY
jgi:hypothetical protein